MAMKDEDANLYLDAINEEGREAWVIGRIRDWDEVAIRVI